MKRSIKTLALATALLTFGSATHAAVVDLGFTLGVVNYQGVTLTGQLIRVGTFTGYSDSTGASWFSGKDHSTLLGSFNPLSLQGTSTTNAFFEDSGTPISAYYGSYDLGSTAQNTRIFAWIYSGTTTASPAWALLSGTIGGSGDFNTSWLAVAPSDITVNVIEAAVTQSVVYSSNPVGASVEATGIDNNGNLTLVPEPSTGALLMIGTVGLVALRRLRKV